MYFNVLFYLFYFNLFFFFFFFYVCMNELSIFCSPNLHLSDQEYSKIVKYYYNIKQLFSMLISVKL